MALIRVFIFTLTLAVLRRPGRAMRQLSASGKKTGRDARRTYALSVFCSVGVICRNRSGIIGFDLVARNARARSVFTPLPERRAARRARPVVVIALSSITSVCLARLHRELLNKIYDKVAAGMS